MTIHKYGYDDGKRGLEAEYCVNDGTLYIKIFGSDHWRDYAVCLFAWPRKIIPHGKVHRVWANMAVSLAVDIMMVLDELPGDVRIVGHSMGGSVASILPAMLRYKTCTVFSVNAPKAGNKQFIQWLQENVTHVAYYDTGDVVRFLPVFYARYRNQRAYADSKGISKAHNNMPYWWDSFPDKVRI